MTTREELLERVYGDYVSLNQTLDETVAFFNHGYFPFYPEYENHMFKSSMSLYRYMLDGVETKGKRILDVGCGRGGFSLVFKDLNFSKMYGCDLVDDNIEYCEKHFSKLANFKVCDALELSNNYRKNYFDIITNVESSNYYFDKNLFFQEVKKILKPDGLFLYTELFRTELGESELFNHFKIVSKEDITENVLSAVEKDKELFLKIENELTRTFLLETVVKYAEQMLKEMNVKYIKYVCEKYNFDK